MTTLALQRDTPLTTDWQARVARAFSRAAPRYDELATAQQRIGEGLWQALPTNASSVLDVGCGTGYWTQRLAERYPAARVIGVDIAPGMLDQARNRPTRVDWRQGDAGALPVESASIGLVFSSLALQWCTDMDAVMAEFSRVLAPGGRAVITTLLAGTLEEIAFAWQRPEALLAYKSAAHYGRAAESAGLDVVRQCEHRERYYYPDMRAVMASIKGVGAQVPRPSSSAALTRRDVEAAAARLETRRTPQGLPVSYRCLTLTLERPSTPE
ncbi:methyltransferase domain-containing protein [Vreelandella subglaciescola]|jgi:malonyl-CoA O-methyltransferase|uniref:Malonyl-[acyl-carrier protein] O-methyltransferase n=1 Tax=Vreelandella subglaciescola TaxID=29571 RepID=A0A1M7G3G9_9GAMM|nr:methyltransferase domain-containing protein [Halomonas subglaciescola]SHM10823.1 malonyl-CoA O-methyltransferase [Halomonas subglaciescola]